ncbi:type IV pilus modification PilV family protein [Pseudoalteromonas tunicata]|jgi:prepilin-type N-terminal cleavage/methylation domain-containing protein|uniref:Prepilin-type N-terminal cleavage/methylation domain-containing protein n=1 Tax=Pseudoalteromonas tunicata D2 TaxID=87626 RepID=A4C8H2_9GAMM|nr:prepilin-type N-terminal cleavage/methylation domain-containing protein [Pseudoalteromonas tunicata]ATC93391.1 hypothetical protein PTUN_a0624 [Pseudoalteromonas tunicata]AXT32435.1 prepilin-type N-terminal cleavage/methylation domain-containing protein [Pseudoalteromonas tunicata]EAR28887.1 hypothetical protein PTD2_07584 [Pseudoalteromonas tunicata D2]
MLKNNRKKNQRAGFTLIEVMIASVILFSSISVLALIYKGVVVSTIKAEEHVSISFAVPFIQKEIRKNILSNTKPDSESMSGQGNILNAKYKWSANVTLYESPPKSYDPETGALVTHPKKYKKWLVDLSISVNSTNQSYQYGEVSWHE